MPPWAGHRIETDVAILVYARKLIENRHKQYQERHPEISGL